MQSPSMGAQYVAMQNILYHKAIGVRTRGPNMSRYILGYKPQVVCHWRSSIKGYVQWNYSTYIHGDQGVGV